MAQPSYPPFVLVSQPSDNPGEQPTNMTQPPLGYPPVAPPIYPTAPPQASTYAYAPPTTVTQHTCPPAPHPSYPPAPHPGYSTVSQPSYPPAPHPGYSTVSQPSYPPAPHPGYSTVSQPSYPPAPHPGYSTVSQPSYPPAPHPGHSTSTVPQPSYTAPVPAPTPQLSHSAITTPMPFLGLQYCLPRIVDLSIVRKLRTLTDDFVVTDVDKNVIFKVKGKVRTLHDNRVLLDACGNPVITLRRKILSAHSRWQAFRGSSNYPTDLIFTAKVSSVIQLKTKLNVYLANRITEEVSDFILEGSWSKSSCVVYVGESTTVAAQMRKEESAESYFLGKDTLMVTVYPNIDYAFVVALIVILDAIDSGDHS